MSDSDGFASQQSPEDGTQGYNEMAFVVAQLLALISTASLVQVKAVTNDGGVAKIGTVDVLPLVKLVDGVGKSSSHGTLYKLPYFRMQGARKAVILDPEVGDVGLAVFADRDISAVKANVAESTPGSRRRFDMGDGLYIGSMLSKDPPEMYVRFFSEGIEASPDSGETLLTLKPGLIRLVADQVQLHGKTKTTIDANGTGYVLQSNGNIDTYSDGGSHSGSHPPEVPN